MGTCSSCFRCCPIPLNQIWELSVGVVGTKFTNPFKDSRWLDIQANGQFENYSPSKWGFWKGHSLLRVTDNRLFRRYAGLLPGSRSFREQPGMQESLSRNSDSPTATPSWRSVLIGEWWMQRLTINRSFKGRLSARRKGTPCRRTGRLRGRSPRAEIDTELKNSLIKRRRYNPLQYQTRRTKQEY
jgi:hypothetical protein